jgi:lipoprotein-releasing system permease protein
MATVCGVLAAVAPARRAAALDPAQAIRICAPWQAAPR